jgi:hypothetical protein
VRVTQGEPYALVRGKEGSFNISGSSDAAHSARPMKGSASRRVSGAGCGMMFSLGQGQWQRAGRSRR